ncbi:MAG TPA: GGDEF domain-containing protein [Silvibacterium sp.]|nr:GGDEF domain-containing protein [Silvibacterium sp.]
MGLAVLFLYFGWMTLALPALSLLYDCVALAGVLLAWRFHSSRTFLALLVLFLAREAETLFLSPAAMHGDAALTAVEVLALLAPLNLIAIALMHEGSITVSSVGPIGLFLFVQSVMYAVVFRGGAMPAPVHARSHHPLQTIAWPAYIWFVLAAAGLFLLLRFLFTRKPIDSAFLWCLGAATLSLYFVANAPVSAAYALTAAAILALSIIENSYLLAYHDELTTLPSRRAFNDALLRLREPYAIAVVDIDHFKRFNDTYGHETGDQVLRLVAANLSRVTGGGESYRCGGEEFTILFPGKTMAEVFDHLEQLRGKIQTAEFRLRGTDRRHIPPGAERRRAAAGSVERRTTERRDRQVRQRARSRQPIRLSPETLAAGISVTVSIGAAGSDGRPADYVLQAADKALYRAKAKGRNRVEMATSMRRTRTKAAEIA